jgi:hypothetical protein
MNGQDGHLETYFEQNTDQSAVRHTQKGEKHNLVEK